MQIYSSRVCVFASVCVHLCIRVRFRPIAWRMAVRFCCPITAARLPHPIQKRLRQFPPPPIPTTTRCAYFFASLPNDKNDDNMQGRLSYYIGGETMTLCHLEHPMYMLGYLPKEDRVYLMDKQQNIYSYRVRRAMLQYQVNYSLLGLSLYCCLLAWSYGRTEKNTLSLVTPPFPTPENAVVRRRGRSVLARVLLLRKFFYSNEYFRRHAVMRRSVCWHVISRSVVERAIAEHGALS